MNMKFKFPEKKQEKNQEYGTILLVYMNYLELFIEL
jgi:hypothetical protein